MIVWDAFYALNIFISGHFTNLTLLKFPLAKSRDGLKFNSIVTFIIRSKRDWVAGHISALSMAEFGREFTFSIFRDRKIRALSHYRFMRFWIILLMKD